MQTRRRFLATMTLTGAAGIVSPRRTRAAERPLETTSVRIAKIGAICLAPQYVSEELLRAEGFTDIRYVDKEISPGTSKLLDPAAIGQAIGRGVADFSTAFAVDPITAIDAGSPIVVLAGVHVGCYELFAKPEIRHITELEGKSVAADSPLLLTLMAAQVGLDPAADIHWVTSTGPSFDPLKLFAEGKIDAFLGFPPNPQELRARQIGHVIVSTATDRPWSQYFCCMLTANQEYVRNYPVATKRAMRAILKAADLCANEPARVARTIVDRRFTDRYDYALQTLNDIPYDKWREYDAEDTMRFYALRMHEAGLIKSSPQKIIAEGTDWHFLDEIKRELKA
jgi:NitT/TauT family transport system substrate-binding protein